MPGSLVAVLVLLPALKLAARLPDLITALLASVIAVLLRLRDARDQDDLGACAVAPHRLGGAWWHRDGREQRLLNRATKNTLSTIVFVSHYPSASARGICIADTLQRTADQRRARRMKKRPDRMLLGCRLLGERLLRGTLVIRKLFAGALTSDTKTLAESTIQRPDAPASSPGASGQISRELDAAHPNQILAR